MIYGKRIKAMEWWKNLSDVEKLQYANDYFTTDDVNSLTIKQISELSYYLFLENRYPDKWKEIKKNKNV